MNKDSEPGRRLPAAGQRWGFESLSKAAIRRQLLLDAMQHPATMLPVTVCVGAGLYLLLVSPVFGGGRVATSLLGIAGLAAASGFVWRYVIRYSNEYTKRLRELTERQEQERARLEEEAAVTLRDELRVRFSAIGSDPGLKALRELIEEYEQLLPALVRRQETDPLTITAVPALVVATYRQGLSVLLDAVQVMEAAHGPGRARFEREAEALQTELEALPGGEFQAERRQIKEETLAFLRERLRMLDQLGMRAEHLIHQASRCDASLNRTRFDLGSIREGNSQMSVDAVTEALRRTITLVKEVQEEMSELGY